MKGNNNSNKNPNPTTPGKGSSSSGKTVTTPLSPLSPPANGNRPYSTTRKNIPRADSPNCTVTGPTTIPITTSTFLDLPALTTEHNSLNQTQNNGMLFLLRELGLRLLYNSDRDDYYNNLRAKYKYITDFKPVDGIDFSHQLFASIRNNHRVHKTFISSGNPLDQTSEIYFRDGKIIKESFSSNIVRGTETYYETIDHRISYTDDPSARDGAYYSYEHINTHAASYFPNGDFARTLNTKFKQILKGESINEGLTTSQQQFIYTLFYHLFVIEGSRDPASYLTIPMAISYLAELEVTNPKHGLKLLEAFGKKAEGIIPICFFEAMRALSHMGDVVFKDHTSIQYSNSYNGTEGKPREEAYKHVNDKTNALFNNWRARFGNSDNIFHQLLILSHQWYGFMPRIHQSPNIQRFGALGMQAEDVPYDGNCFFHAFDRLLHALGRNEHNGEVITPELLRRIASDNEPNPEIRPRIAQDRRWLDLDSRSIAATLARVLGVNIALIPDNFNPNDIQAAANNIAASTSAGDPQHPNEVIYIGNIQNVHFVSLNIADDTNFQPVREAVGVAIIAKQQDDGGALAAEEEQAPEAPAAAEEQAHDGLGNMNPLADALPPAPNQANAPAVPPVQQGNNYITEEDLDEARDRIEQFIQAKKEGWVLNGGGGLVGFLEANGHNYAQPALGIFLDNLTVGLQGGNYLDWQVAVVAAINDTLFNTHFGVFSVINITHDNEDIYSSIFYADLDNKKALNFINPEIDKLFTSFAPHSVISNSMSDSLSIIVIPNELASLNFEQLSNIFGHIYTWFTDNYPSQ